MHIHERLDPHRREPHAHIARGDRQEVSAGQVDLEILGRAHALDEWIDVEKTKSLSGAKVGLGILLATAGVQ